MPRAYRRHFVHTACLFVEEDVKAVCWYKGYFRVPPGSSHFDM